MKPEIERAAKEAAREWGKKGGRPRKAGLHPAGEAVPAKGCTCIDCRKARGWIKGERGSGAAESGASEKSSIHYEHDFLD